MKRTLSAGGVVVHRGRVAVVKQRGDVWSLPKGHLKKKETAEEAARREIREEAGIRKLELVGLLGEYTRPKIGLENVDDPTEMKTIRIFHFTTEQKKVAPEDKKILDACWMSPKKAVKALTHPKDAEFLRSVLDRI